MNKENSHSALQSPFVLKTNAFGERHFYQITRGIFDKVGAAVVFDNQFKNQLFLKNKLYIITGTDSGLLPRYIQQRGVPTGSRYLFIELNEVLENLQQAQLIPDLDPAIAIVNETNYVDQMNEFKLNEYFFIDAVCVHSALCCQQHTMTQYAELEWALQEHLQAQRWRSLINILGSQTFLTQQVENSSDTHLPAQILQNTFKGQTAIILAGGPSLDEILPWVVENRHHLVVFTVARIAKQLQALNITPDFIFSVDPYEISFNMCSEIFSFSTHPVLIHANHVIPTLLNQWHGLSLYLATRLPWESELNITNVNGIGPTVTNSALATAASFGFETILLGGVDLCYTKHGITHAKGSAEEQAGPAYDTTPQVLTYNEEYRNTGGDFYIALQVLSAQAKQITENNEKCQIINLSKDAARAEHIIHIPPEALTLKAQQPCRSIIEHHVTQYQKKHKKTEYLAALLEELTQAQYQIKKILQLTQKGRQTNQQLFNEFGLIEKSSRKKNLDRIEKALNKKYKKYSKLTQLFSINGLIKITTPHEDEHELSAKEIQELGEIYYQAYEEGAEKLLQVVTKAIKRTQSRLEEYSAQPNLDQLIEQWRADQSLRRGSLWKKARLDIKLPEELENKLTQLDKEFDAFCETAKQKNTQRLETMLAQTHLIPRTAKHLFHHRKKLDLIHLHDSLLQDKKNQSHLDYQALIKAYVAELDGQFETAQEHYDTILNYDNSPLLEEALSRIAAISTQQQDYNNVYLAMKCLSQLSPLYLPHFADATRLSGDTLAAIDIYNQYISLFPEDIETQLKLIQVYIDSGLPKAAQILLNHLSEKKPDLSAVHQLKKKIELAHTEAQ